MLKKFNRLLALAAALLLGFGLQAQAQAPAVQPATDSVSKDAAQAAIVERAIRRRQLAAARAAEAERLAPARAAALAAAANAPKTKASLAAPAAGAAKLVGAVPPPAPPGVMNPLGTPDYMGGIVPNYANSPMMRKFVDTLPGLGAANKNNLGAFIPVATADTTTFPGSDYYHIGLKDYTQQMHSDLPPTHLRGYADLSATGDSQAHYLGPVIIAHRDVPVRVRFDNLLGTGAAGNLKIPVDATMMGSIAGPSGTTYTQNRAELHLHGGLNPWISDGTPHQWFTPAGDPTPNKKGLSFRNVPDMGKVLPSGAYPGTAGDGVGTYFWSNQQSGRFMFYHDHAFGLTRLNVYSGEAAGYLIVDPMDDALIAAGILPTQGGGVYQYGIPLVIQDKTFVPGPTQLAAQDPTWDTAHWGGFGDLWFPHVYMPNQNPASPTGANAMGRWDYAPWFWPPTQVSTDPLNTPQGFLPYGHGAIPGVNPGDPAIPGTPNPSLTPESFMDTPVVNGTAYPSLTVQPQAYRFRILNAANDRMMNLSFFQADATGTEVPMVPAAPPAAGVTTWPAYWPTDGRDGGVPDPLAAGPSIIQIGTESGFLPTPVVIPPTPVGYNYNRRDIVVLNVADHSLFLGPAERADVIVDFSAFAGKTLILYNDAPAPVPAFDSRLDYYTGDPDQTAQGGAPTTLPGYGPNTRTMMQIKVAASAPAAAFNLVALQAAFTSTPTKNSAFAATQHLPVVPHSRYNTALGTTYPDIYSTIQANYLPYARTENGQPSQGRGGSAVIGQYLEPKAIQELWEMDYGRMNATLGVELPYTNINIQTTIPLGYVDPATELLNDGETQLWKITHNGVDSHPVHFHLVDVQLVNRVGWDGAVRFPDPNEGGWKETIRMNPLEDVIVAFRPLSPVLPFAITNSSRLLDPTQPAGANLTLTDPASGNQIAVSNLTTNFGWEYVWHCHILGHEENDFMRPVVLSVATTVPGAPTGLVATRSATTRVDLAWTDHANNETGFRIERQTGGAGAFTKVGTTVPDQASYSDLTAVAGTAYAYRVYAYNQKGDSAVSNVANAVTTVVPSPTGVTLVASPVTSAPFGTAVTFTAAGVGASGYQYQFLVNGTVVQNYSATATYGFTTTQPAGAYTVAVNVRTSLGSTVVTTSISYTITPPKATGVTLAPNLPSPQQAGKGIIFTATGLGSTLYQYQFSLNGVVVQAYSATATYALDPFIAPGTYTIKADVRTNTASLVPDASATLSYTVLAATPATGVTLTPSVASPQGAGTVVTFTALGRGSLAYQYQFSLNGAIVQAYSATATWNLPTTTLPGTYLVGVQVRTSTAVTQDALASISYVIVTSTPTGVLLTPSAASPQPAGTAVVFTAAGQGSTGYQYEFLVNSVIVLGYSATNTYTFPTSQLAGTYTVQVNCKSTLSPVIVSASLPYTLTVPAPATGLTLTPSLAGPNYTTGTAVTFLAVGSGSANYQYSFYLFNGTTWTNVQAWGSTNTWTLPPTTTPGTYTLQAWVRTTSTVTYDQYKSLTFNVIPTPATGVTVTPSTPAPYPVGNSITFTALGQGAANYQYAFYLYNGSTWSAVQPYSATATWTLPSNTPLGSYTLQVWVRTSTGVTYDSFTTFAFQIVQLPATGVTVTPSLAGTVFSGTSGVTFNAAGVGASNYQYAFYLYNGSTWTQVQAYSTTSGWALPNPTTPGSYTLQVWVRTTNSVAYDAWTALSFTVN